MTQPTSPEAQKQNCRGCDARNASGEDQPGCKGGDDAATPGSPVLGAALASRVQQRTSRLVAIQRMHGPVTSMELSSVPCIRVATARDVSLTEYNRRSTCYNRHKVQLPQHQRRSLAVCCPPLPHTADRLSSWFNVSAVPLLKKST